MSIKQNTYKYNASIIRVSKMNKWIYLALLFGISTGLFFLGMFANSFAVAYHTCVDYVLAGEISFLECKSYLNSWWLCIASFIGLFIALIFLTKRGGKVKK
jgi:hypothetical protein